MEDAHTSDTLDTDFLSQQPPVTTLEQSLSGVYSIEDDQQILQYLMQRVTIDKPLSLYRLLQQLQNQHTKVLCRRGQQVNSNSTSHKPLQVQETQQYIIGVWNDWGKNSNKGNSFQKSQVKNIYEQHNYQRTILNQLTSLYIAEGDNQLKGAIQHEGTCKNQLQRLQDGQINGSLAGDSDNNCSCQQYYYQKAILQSNPITNECTSSITKKTNLQLSIVSHSLHSVQSLLNKLSLFRRHSKSIMSKIKLSKFNIHKLHSLKQNKKQYLSHLMNIQAIEQTKLCAVKLSGEQEENVLRGIEEMIMKYQYSPYVFLLRTLQDRLYGIVSRRISVSRQVRLMSLSGKVVLHLLQQFIPLLLTTTDSHSKQLTLTTVSRNLLKLLMYLKPDSYQCIDTKSSCYLNSHYQNLLQQHFVILSLTKLTKYITLQEFTKLGSVMQFSGVSQRIYSVLRYVWLSLYQVGLEWIYSVFCPLLKQAGKDNHNNVNSNDKRKELTRSFCDSMGISSDRLHEHYGRIGHTLQAITEMLQVFQPKYNWCYNLVVGRNVAVLRCSAVVEYGSNTSNNRQPVVCMYLIDRLFKQVKQYHMRTVSVIESKLMFDYVFNSNNSRISNTQIKAIGNSEQLSLLSVARQIMFNNKQQEQMGRGNKSNFKNKCSKDKAQKKEQSKRLVGSSSKQSQYTTPKRRRKGMSKCVQQRRCDNSAQQLLQQQQHCSPQAVCSVQFAVMQRVQLQKMLVFDNQLLRTIQSQRRVDRVECEIVQLIQRLCQLGQSDQKPNVGSSHPNSYNIISKLLQLESQFTNSTIQEMDEVKQFQAVLLKLIIQNATQGKYQCSEVFSQMDRRMRCREIKISVLNSMLVTKGSRSGIDNNNLRRSNKGVSGIQEVVYQQTAQLQSLILNSFQINKHRNHNNTLSCDSCDRQFWNKLQQRVQKVVDLISLGVQQLVKTKNNYKTNPHHMDQIVTNDNHHYHHKQQQQQLLLMMMSSLIIKLLIMIQILQSLYNRSNNNNNDIKHNSNSKSNNSAKGNPKNGSFTTAIQSPTQVSTNSVQQRQQSCKVNNKKSFFKGVIARITKQKKKPDNHSNLSEKQQNYVKSHICQLNHLQQQVENNTQQGIRQRFQMKRVLLLSLLDVLRRHQQKQEQ